MADSFSTVLKDINQLSTDELDELIQALSQRYAQLHPGWEIAILTLPKDDPVERGRILARVLEYENKQREGQ